MCKDCEILQSFINQPGSDNNIRHLFVIPITEDDEFCLVKVVNSDGSKNFYAKNSEGNISWKYPSRKLWCTLLNFRWSGQALCESAAVPKFALSHIGEDVWLTQHSDLLISKFPSPKKRAREVVADDPDVPAAKRTSPPPAKKSGLETHHCRVAAVPPARIPLFGSPAAVAASSLAGK